MALRKNRPTVHRVSLGFIRLWRDDLAEMVDVIAESSQGQSIDIKLGDEYSVDAIDDLAEYPDQRVESVTVDVGDGRIRLVLSRQEASISVTEPSLTDRGMVSEIRRLAQKNSSWRQEFLQIVGPVIQAAAAAMSFGAVGPRLNSRAVVFTKTRQEAPPFWTRKRDDIWIAFVSLVIGGVIGYLVNMIT